MSQEVGEQYSQHQEEKRHHRHKLLARIGLILLIFSLISWGASTAFIFLAKNIPAHTLTRIVPTTLFPKRILDSGVCLYANSRYSAPGDSLNADWNQPLGPLAFTVMPGQSDPAVQTVTLRNHCEGYGEVAWSGNAMTYQGTHWLTINQTQGSFRNSQSVSIIVSSRSLTEGVYTGHITFTSLPFLDSLDIQVVVDVVWDRQHPLLGDIVAYTHLSDLTIVAEWSHLTKDQSVNMTILLLSSKNLSRILSHSATPITRPTTQYMTNPFEPINNTGFIDATSGFIDDKDGIKDNFLESAFGSQLVSLDAQMDGTAFDISPSTPSPQDPYKRVASFHWNILPKEAGPQEFEVRIAGQWKYQDSQGREQLRMIHFMDGDFSVNVDESSIPFITFGQITFSALLLSLLGSLLNIPWILDYIQKRKEQKKKQHTTSVSTMGIPVRQKGKRRRKRPKRGQYTKT
jgi:hypothetical protein